MCGDYMEAYIDLSIIVYLINITLSFIYAMIIFDNIKYNKLFIFFTIICLFFCGFITIFFIPYFLIFFMILYGLFVAIFDIKLLKSIIMSLLIYYINTSLMLLIGGCFLYQGILLVCIPFISLFVLIQPIYITVVHVFLTLLMKYIKNQKFIFRCEIIINELSFKSKGYYDSGNFLMFNDKPIIFVKKHYYNNDAIIIKLKTIENKNLSYLAYEGYLYIKRKKIEVYIVFVDENMNFNNCDILLNKYVM
jgi:hypothetical protein